MVLQLSNTCQQGSCRQVIIITCYYSETPFGILRTLADSQFTKEARSNKHQKISSLFGAKPRLRVGMSNCKYVSAVVVLPNSACNNLARGSHSSFTLIALALNQLHYPRPTLYSFRSHKPSVHKLKHTTFDHSLTIEIWAHSRLFYSTIVLDTQL